ncbi:hypothetical protein ACG2LH_04400 [Zhouia sp. PK063]|uniref:hypothetical protein n=1 Tax=Zhouia sp. PK063 TaxID=3373602 RepID=UPI0037BC2E1C
MNRIIYTLIVIILFSSCEKNNHETYEIYNILYKGIGKPIELSPEDVRSYYRNHLLDESTITKEDSLKYAKEIIQYNNKGKIFAIGTMGFKKIDDLNESLPKRKNIPKDFELLYQKFQKEYRSTQEENIDITQIRKNRPQDTIILYHKSLIDNNETDFHNFYMLILFSKIVFNDQHDKAIVLISMNRSKLDGATGICFLKKENGYWKQEKYMGLFIS